MTIDGVHNDWLNENYFDKIPNGRFPSKEEDYIAAMVFGMSFGEIRELKKFKDEQCDGGHISNHIFNLIETNGDLRYKNQMLKKKLDSIQTLAAQDSR